MAESNNIPNCSDVPTLDNANNGDSRTKTQVDEIEQTLITLHDNEDIIFVQAFYENRSRTGYFSRENFHEAAEQINVLDDGRLAGEIHPPRAIYINVNSIHPSFICQQEPNSFVIGKSAPSNELIVRRKYFFVDVDPLRASGTPSTPEETAEAKRVRDNIVDYFLSIRHFERMILACSGSGYHILGEMDFDPDPAADSEQIKDQLTDSDFNPHPATLIAIAGVFFILVVLDGPF